MSEFYIVIFITGIIIGAAFTAGIFLIISIKKTPALVQKKVEYRDHHPPQYYGYKGGYDRVTVCEKCKRTGLYNDLHVVNPCERCGGERKESAPKKWDGDLNKWVS